MASNVDKKKIRSVEREQYRGMYKVFKELRLWLCAVLLICIAATVYVGVTDANETKARAELVAGGKLRDVIAVYIDEIYKEQNGISDKHGAISAMTLSYYFYKDYYALINSDSFYKDGYGTYGLDPSKPLKSLEYTALRSWFDELMNSVSANAVKTLQYSVLADIHGVTLGDEENSKINDEVNALREDAKEQGQTLNEHLSYRYCPGMTESDLRYALERYYLAEKYYYEGTQQATVCTDKEVEDYYYEHKNELTSAYIYRYEIKFKDETEDEATERAEAFVACGDANSFFDMIVESAKSDYGMSDEELEKFLTECCITVYPDDYVGDFADWLFKETRVDGDTYMDKNDGYIGVYYVDRAPGKYNFPSVNVRTIYISAEYAGSTEKAKEKAEEVYALALENGTEEYFTKLVKEYTHDTNTISYGGAYVDIVPGDLNREFEIWAFQQDRKVGDIGLIEVDGDYFINYVTEFGKACWRISAERELIASKMEAFEKEIENTAKVSSDAKAIYEDVPDNLATDASRGYAFKEKDGKLVVVSEKMSVAFIVLLISDIVVLGFTVFAFIYKSHLKKKYDYNF